MVSVIFLNTQFWWSSMKHKKDFTMWIYQSRKEKFLIKWKMDDFFQLHMSYTLALYFWSIGAKIFRGMWSILKQIISYWKVTVILYWKEHQTVRVSFFQISSIIMNIFDKSSFKSKSWSFILFRKIIWKKNLNFLIIKEVITLMNMKQIILYLF